MGRAVLCFVLVGVTSLVAAFTCEQAPGIVGQSVGLLSEPVRLQSAS